MKNVWQKMVRKGRSLRDRMEDYQETITFAEAGEGTAAAAADNTAAEEQPGLLLVIGNGNTFSQRIIEYALEMAQRMSHEILALNMAPLPAETFTLLTPPRSKMKEFEEASRTNAQSFQEAAAAAGIPFQHTVKFGETEAVIEEVGKEYGLIDFVISEPERQEVARRPEKENRPEQQLHVYSMV